MDSSRLARLRTVTYWAALFTTLHGSIAAYVNSSFLATFVPEALVGLVFSLGSALTIFVIQAVSHRLASRGLVPLFNFWAVVGLLSTIWLMTAEPSALLIGVFLLYLIGASVIRFLLDVYLEELTSDHLTGSVRGVFMTAINGAWLLSPLAAAWLIGVDAYQNVYFVSAVALVPALILGLAYLWEVPHAPFRHVNVLATIETLLVARHAIGRNLRSILAIDFLLNAFYAVMVVYMPLYLHQHLGFSWAQLAIVFTFMLLPFVLLELPLGRLADEKLGEKEILIAGLVIAAFFTMLVPFVTDASLIGWTVLLVGTRIGASAIEIMKETYLFKQIGAADTAVITLSRVMPPLAYVVAPLVASFLLLFISIPVLFFLLGFVVLIGLWPAWQLEDTK